MPSGGGLPIFITFCFSTLFLFSDVIPRHYIVPVLLGAAVIVITGLIDDRFEISPKQKSIGILLAALIICFVANVRMDTMTLPFLGFIKLGWLSYPITIFWIFGITNAVNLIDGLDGLAAGVSIIGLTSMGIIGYFFLHANTIFIPIVIFCLVASIAGFFPYNFHPAKIYLGDTGALFLGFMISVLSLQGLKNVTFVSLVSPLIILAVPVTDTFFAMARRKLGHKSISTADKKHLHHRLLALGFTHRGAVLTIYAMCFVFSFVSIVINYMSRKGMILLITMMGITFWFLLELIGLIPEKYAIITKSFRLFGDREYRIQVFKKYFRKK
jgi:UDP-GlcNAc:undecaprenyl-phosphate GlcNAc-1-phosphate transferase